MITLRVAGNQAAIALTLQHFLRQYSMRLRSEATAAMEKHNGRRLWMLLALFVIGKIFHINNNKPTNNMSRKN
jgi:hypothetical protein